VLTLSLFFLPPSAGAAFLAGALEVNESLESLTLSNAMIGDNGADAIAQALPKNRRLTNLDLSDNVITDHGGLVLGVAVRKRDAKTNLHIFGNLQMTSESYEKLEELLVDLLELKTTEEEGVKQLWEEEKKEKERIKGKQERSRLRKEVRRKKAQADEAAQAEADMGAYLTQMRGECALKIGGQTSTANSCCVSIAE
jgi:hypothetical protein